MYEYNKKRYKGRNNPAFNSLKVQCDNPNCDNKIYVTKSETKYYNNNFCNKDCHAEYKSIVLVGKNNHMYGKKYTEKEKKKMWESRKNIWKSEEFRKQQSQIMKKKWETEDYRKKQRKKLLAVDRSGKNNPSWKGGLSFEPYPAEWNSKFKEQIRDRDNRTCQLCGINEKNTQRKLSVHHIDYDKENCDPNNLISLCIICHLKTNGNREYWESKLNKDTSHYQQKQLSLF